MSTLEVRATERIFIPRDMHKLVVSKVVHTSRSLQTSFLTYICLCVFQEQVSDVTEVTASFKSINFLVIRSVSLNGMKSVRKIAEVAVGEVQLNASLGECQRLDGSLGGFRIIDLTPEGSLYRTVYVRKFFRRGYHHKGILVFMVVTRRHARRPN